MNNENSKMEMPAKKPSFFSRPKVQSVTIIIVVFSLLAGFLYWLSVRDTIFIENSYLEAPIATMGATSAGILNAIYVKEGDRVSVGQQIALVGSEVLYAKDSGLISSAPQVVGGYYAQGATIVSIVGDKDMKVVGLIDETKGLDEVATGQPVTFTVDTFKGKTYEGTVEKVSVTSNDTGVVFSISDKRPIKKFKVYVRFDVASYPELKSGMSAKITINSQK